MQTMTGTPLVMITAARAKTRHAVPERIKVVIMMLMDKLGRRQIQEEVEDPENQIHMSSGIIASPKVCLDLKTAHQKGDDAFVTFCKHRLQGIETDLNCT